MSWEHSFLESCQSPGNGWRPPPSPRPHSAFRLAQVKTDYQYTDNYLGPYVHFWEMNSNNEYMYLNLNFVHVFYDSGVHAFPRPDSNTWLAACLRHHHAEWVCAWDGPGIFPTRHASPQVLWCGFPPKLRGTSLTDERNVFYSLF